MTTKIIRPSNFFKLSFLSVISAIFAAIASILFLLAIDYISKVYSVLGGKTQDELSDGFIKGHWWLLIILPLGGLLVGILTQYLMPDRKNVGLAGVIEAVHERDAKIKLKEGIGVTVISALSIGFGASVGRFGPAIHIGASIGSWLSQILGLDRTSRITLLACAAASAIACSFNAPFAGVVFAHEVIIRNYSLRIFTPVAIASTIGALIGRFYKPLTLFPDTIKVSIPTHFEYLAAAIVGLLAAIVTVTFLKSLLYCQRIGEGFNIDARFKPAIGGIFLALIAMVLPQTLGLSSSITNVVVFGTYTDADVWVLLAILLGKMAAVSLSFGMGFNGGLFGPAMVLGAMTSGLVIYLFHFLGFDLKGSTIVLVGIGCIISAVFGAPLATTIIAIELCNSHKVASAVLVGVVTTNLITYKLFGKSYFNFILKKKDIDTRHSREKAILSQTTIKDLVKKPVTINPNAGRSEIIKGLEACDGEQELYVVDEKNSLLGMIRALYIVNRSDDIISSEVMKNPKMVLLENDSIEKAISLLGDFAGLGIPVVNNHEESILVGFTNESALMNFYTKIVKEIREEQEE